MLRLCRENLLTLLIKEIHRENKERATKKKYNVANPVHQVFRLKYDTASYYSFLNYELYWSNYSGRISKVAHGRDVVGDVCCDTSHLRATKGRPDVRMSREVSETRVSATSIHYVNEDKILLPPVLKLVLLGKPSQAKPRCEPYLRFICCLFIRK